MELIQIVDKNGKFTGEIMDRKEAHDKNLPHNEVAAFIINDKKQVLLQKRSPNKRFNPNKWALCAGHVDAYESLENAMLREIKEEIGIDVSINDLKRLGNREVNIRETNSHITYYYYVKVNLKEEDFVIQKEELSMVKWFDIDEVVKMILNHDDSIVFKENRIKIFERLKEI